MTVDPFPQTLRSRGQVLIVAMVLLALTLALTTASVSLSSFAARSSGQIAKSRLLTQAAAAGIDRALWCLNQTSGPVCGNAPGGGYPGESSLPLGSASVSIIVTAPDYDTRNIAAIASLAGLSKKIQATARRSRYEIAFPYGVHVGRDGLEMDEGAVINGNLFSNGDVYGDKKTKINGDATVASTTLDKVTVNGTARARAVSNATINGDAYYQTITKSTVSGASYPGSPDPAPLPLSITPEIVEQFRNDARSGGTLLGNYEPADGAVVSLGPKEITGDLTLENNQTLNLTGTVYVRGEITIDNNASIRLDASYGAYSGIILADGPIHLKNNGVFAGAGPGSFLLFLGTAVGGGHHDSAFDLHNNASGAIFYATNGLINLHNNVIASELTGQKIHLSNNAVIQYDSALEDAVFTASPSGLWYIEPGTRRETP